MGTQVRIVDPSAFHLKRRAYQLGEKVRAKGGGLLTEVQDGFLIRAQGNRDTVVVNVLGVPAVLTSPLYDIYTIGGVGRIVREVRLPEPLLRYKLDSFQQSVPPDITLGLDLNKMQPWAQGVAVMAGAPFQSIANGSWATKRPVFQRSAILQTATTHRVSGDQHWVDTVIYRATAGRHGLPDAEGNAIEFRANAPVGRGELAYIVFDAASIGFLPSTDTGSTLARSIASDWTAEDGVVACDSGYPGGTVGQFHLVRYHVDLDTSAVSILWRYEAEDLAPTMILVTEAAGRLLCSRVINEPGEATKFDSVLVMFDKSGVQGQVVILDETYALTNEIAYEHDGMPWFFCPRIRPREPDVPPSAPWVTLDQLDTVLVDPSGALHLVSTPGFFVQRAVDHVAQSGPEPGQIGTPGTSTEGAVAWYGYEVPAEHAVINACVCAPGVLAVVVVPEADYAVPNQRRYIAFVSASTGAFLGVCSAPVVTADIWHQVSVTCVEQGTVDETGNIATPGILLVSSWRQYVAGLDVGLPDPANIGVWMTGDNAETLHVLYQLPFYEVMQPVAMATYLGSPLLPADINVTRRQWVGSSTPAP